MLFVVWHGMAAACRLRYDCPTNPPAPSIEPDLNAADPPTHQTAPSPRCLTPSPRPCPLSFPTALLSTSARMARDKALHRLGLRAVEELPREVLVDVVQVG